MNTLADRKPAARVVAINDRGVDPCILPQEPFLRMLYLEQKRTERSNRRFVLMLLESSRLLTRGSKNGSIEAILSALSTSTRATDIMGWYKDGAILGTIFTEIGSADGNAIANALLTKFTSALSKSLSIEQINQIRLSFHVFPDDWESHGDGAPTASVLYTGPKLDGGPKTGLLWVKRGIDILGSLSALVVLSPLLLTTAIAVKLTSKGPIVFRQPRVGLYGRHFTFFKFRSMYTKNDATVHETFVLNFMKNSNGTEQPNNRPEKLYKLTNDPRITSVGKFLRRTSLDELPQLINVLRGEMSLVGPRPPIPYEVKRYDIWHRRRLLEVKPGITGLWQVTGRSRVGFADMVRLDLRYAKSWSLWLDLKILLQTPRAVLSGDGAH
jgi:lipopolysaccharide/colanic/teichoic acid biosynthesis glycosyltransferase